jgi:hypothetical protein
VIETLALAALLAVPAWLTIWRRPDLTPLMLFAWVALTGWLFARLGFSGPSKLLKDILFVLPLYALVFAARPQLTRNVALTTTLVLAAALFAGLVVLQIANPNVSSVPVALLGAKVWLLYIPLVVAAGAVLTEPAHLRQFLRGCVVVSLIVFTVGMLHVVLSVGIGYRTAISITHGAAAANATQGFTQFGQGAFFGRIPATFASFGEYYLFCGVGIAVAYAAFRFERRGLWKALALLTVALGCAAYLMSGSRGALLFIPMLLVVVALLERRLGGVSLIVVAAALPAMWLMGGLTDVDLGELAAVTKQLTIHYGTDVSTLGTWEMMQQFPLGQGTGSGTNAARHLGQSAQPGLVYEGLYGKAAHELGALGPFLLLTMFAAGIGAGLRALLLCRNTELEQPLAALLAYFCVLPVWASKGAVLDLDPTNVLAWVLLAVVLRMPRLAVREPTAAAQGAPTHPFLASLKKDPVILRRSS